MAIRFLYFNRHSFFMEGSRSAWSDYLSAQYWSDVFSWQDVGVDINHGTAVLHVTESGQDLFDVPVYLFTESGSYLGRFERTDSSGQVQFLLPANSYKFRVDYDGNQYWSDVITLISHEENNIDLQLELLADLTNDPRPVRFDGVPPVYEPKKIMVASLSSVRGLLVQSVVSQTTGEQKIYYFINDHLGTPQKLLNENADVIWSADYKPFGEADENVNTFANNFRFPGQYFDQETGLNYNWHRYYDPTIGRYLRADPIGLAGMDPNIYGYVLNDPVNAIDPYGLFIGTLMKPIVRALGTGAQEAHIASRVGDAMTSAGITAGAIPDPGARISDFIPGGKTTVDASLGSAQVWGGGQTIVLGSGLVLSGGAVASTGGLALAGWGGWEIGQGFNRLWQAFSGQLPGEDIYDWLHPDPCK